MTWGHGCGHFVPQTQSCALGETKPRLTISCIIYPDLKDVKTKKKKKIILEMPKHGKC